MRKAGLNSRRIAIVTVAVAALMAGGGAEVLGSAQVHPRMSIKVKREVGSDTFKGRIRAKDEACANHRKLKLVIRKPNRDKVRAGTARTGSNGRWKFVPPPHKDVPGYSYEANRYAEPGEWRAKVREENVGGVRCAAGKTSPIHIG